jgi:hypothetical protein
MDGSDSSSIAVLIAWQRRTQEKKQALQFTDVPAAMASLASLYGVDAMLPGFPVTQHHSATPPEVRRPVARERHRRSV